MRSGNCRGMFWTSGGQRGGEAQHLVRVRAGWSPSPQRAWAGRPRSLGRGLTSRQQPPRRGRGLRPCGGGDPSGGWQGPVWVSPARRWVRGHSLNPPCRGAGHRESPQVRPGGVLGRVLKGHSRTPGAPAAAPGQAAVPSSPLTTQASGHRGSDSVLGRGTRKAAVPCPRPQRSGCGRGGPCREGVRRGRRPFGNRVGTRRSPRPEELRRGCSLCEGGGGGAQRAASQTRAEGRRTGYGCVRPGQGHQSRERAAG